eukprot:m.182888 g.182888  ORF g.182888 m.182888 type:complete len:342 (+) comp13591_c9_seq20:91-1116(+)
MIVLRPCLCYTLLAVAVFTAASARAEDQRCSDFTNSHTIDDFATGATGAIPYSQCNILLGDLDIICGNGDVLNDLELLRNVHTVTGSVTIQNCPDLTNLDGLRSLATIEGSLIIINNNALENIRGLENLEIVEGNVRVYRNPVLCYVDLFHFERVNEAPLFQIVPNCLETTCDASCTCGFCGSGGECYATCPEESLAWIAAPILICVILIGVLIFFTVRWCKRDDCICDCFCTIAHPIETNEFEEGDLLPMHNFSQQKQPHHNEPGVKIATRRQPQQLQGSPRVANPIPTPNNLRRGPRQPPQQQRVAVPQSIRLPRLKSQQTARKSIVKNLQDAGDDSSV